MDIVKQCFEFAVSQHQEKGQSYGVYEYKFHLEQVADIAKKYSYLLLLGQIGQVICACYGHDLLEDCCNYNDIFGVFGSEVTEIIYAVTNELGRNRKERAEKTYPKIRKNRLAVYVKLCDRIAILNSPKNRIQICIKSINLNILFLGVLYTLYLEKIH